MSVFIAVIFFCSPDSDCKFWKSNDSFVSRNECVKVIRQVSEEMSGNPKIAVHAGNCLEVKWPKVI